VAGLTERRALVLAYHFPPVGGAGVQRNAKFVRYLRDFGYEPVVVTGPGVSADRWAPTDDTLTVDVNGGIGVHRIPGPEPGPSSRTHRRAERWVGLHSPWLRWLLEGMIEVGVRVGAGADLVYASLVPYETAPAAETIARRLGIPWVADLQDPWALDEMMVYPSRTHRRLATHAMRRALVAADAVVMNTPEARDRVLRRFPELAGKPVVSITNGYDAVDFSAPIAQRDDAKFRIVHTGYLHTQLGLDHRRTRLVRRLLGGSMSGVDILTRSHVYLLEAVEQLCREEPELGNRIEIQLAGVLTPADRAVGGRSAAVRMLGYVPHDEAVALVRSADLLFLPMQNLAAGAHVGIVPGKTYEYMASGTPILAAVPPRDVRDFLTAAGTAFVCDPADVAAMKAIVREQVRRKLAGEPRPVHNRAAIAPFERRRLTESLAGLFDRVVAAGT
jgi:glycosyltransferase involved in cell wall biosynthesis